MKFSPVELIMTRVEKNGDSDSARFMELLYAGELILKTTVAAIVASVEDDRENHRYRLLHALIRADGIGEWASKLDEVLIGPASQFLDSALRDDRRAFTERVGPGDWQYEATSRLHRVLVGVNPAAHALAAKVSLRMWFTTFAELRNKTRGHGAITPATCAKLAPLLQESIQQMVGHNPIFLRPWAYLHRNLSGKYNIAQIGGDASVFASLKSSAGTQGQNYLNGIYMEAGRLRRVELIHSDIDLSDFFLPNGAFDGRTYELHSLITDDRLRADAGPYLAVAGDRPISETQGKGELDIVGNVFANLPTVPSGYVKRPELEAEVHGILTNDRHPIATLVGRGGIGKTSVALAVLHAIARTDRYEVIVWFSARDIDLTTAGPKVVQPKVLAEGDIAGDYRALIGAPEVSDDGKKVSALSTMAEHMRYSPLGPTLFVFDNFETVRSPVDLFQWIDTNIRLPNKAVITSRFREFKADFPIEVSGMEFREADELITQTATLLGINEVISTQQRNQIYQEADGHPYIIKIILGEIKDTGSYGKPSKLLVRKDEILDALFDRTFANISPLASRIFLTLSGWRSLVPQLAVEAVMLRHGGDVDPREAVDELVRMSLAERTPAQDGSDFLGVPLAAALFGLKKLGVSPYRALIESDLRFLQDIGPTAATALHEGLYPRILAFFRKIASRISEGVAALDDVRPVLEFMARGYPPAWLLLADLQAEVISDGGLEKSADYIRHFLETQPPRREAEAAWQRLVSVYRATNNVVAGCGAFLGAAEIGEPSLDQISAMANWLNSDRELIEKMDVTERSVLFGPLAALMERHIQGASANDLSRLSWLHLHAGDDGRALEWAEAGLRLDPENLHCERLVERLTA